MKEIKRVKLLCSFAMMLGVMMITTGVLLQSNGQTTSLNDIKIKEFDTENIAASVNQAVENDKVEAKTEKLSLTDVQMQTAPASLLRIEVYQGMTMEEVSAQLNRSLGGILAGHGNTIASRSLELGADPYVAAAIMIHETGNGTSKIANGCYNFGGQKGSGCGAYKRYNSVDEGLIGMIDNLYNNYYAHGLTTVEAIGSRYAESGTWPSMINMYVSKIKSK